MLVSDAMRIISDKIFKNLSDGEWHALGEMLPYADILSPEIASQKYILQTNKPSREQSKKLPLEVQVEKGRKYVVLWKLNNLVRHGRAERGGSGFHRRYRLVPAAEREAVEEEKKIKKTKEKKEKAVLSKGPAGDHQVLQRFGSARARATRLGLRLTYGDDGLTIGNGSKAMVYLSAEHVAAFLDGIEFT